MSTTDDLLRAYLEEMRAAQKREDDGVRAALGSLTSQIQLLGLKMDSQSALQNERFSGLAARVDKLEKNDETTGNHNVDALNKQLAEAKAGRDKLIGWFVGGSGILITGVGSVIWYLLTKGAH